jgi:uncharacterized protein YndB with AHSA1/START domain
MNNDTNNLEVRVKDKVLKPVDEVFEAVVNPDKLCRFFISRATGPLVEGEIVTWFFDDAGVEVAVEGKGIKENELIAFEWAAGGTSAQVELLFTSIDENSTSVTITEKSFPFDRQGVSQALQQTQGWTDFICSLKAFLYCGINLRNGRTKGSF